MQVKTMKSINNAELRFQILSVLKGSKSGLTPKDLTDKLADIFGLTKEEREEFHSQRPYDKVFYKKVATEEQHLQAAKLECFDKKKKIHSITDRGIRALEENAKNKTIEYNFLRKFSEYVRWCNRFKESKRDEIIESNFFDRFDIGNIRFNILLYLSDKEYSSQSEIVEYLSDMYQLTEEELAARYSNGDLKFYKLIAGLEQQLKRAGLETIDKNRHQITEKGIDVLSECKTGSISHKELKTPIVSKKIREQPIQTNPYIENGKEHYANIRERKCTLYIIPHDRFNSKIDNDILKYPCLYILTNSLDNNAECYIGYSGDPIERTSSHKSTKKFVNGGYALIIGYHDNSTDKKTVNHFDICDVAYLEYLAINLAFDLGYPTIANSKGADEPYIKEHAKEEMDEAFKDVKRLISKVGLTIFDN